MLLRPAVFLLPRWPFLGGDLTLHIAIFHPDECFRLGTPHTYEIFGPIFIDKPALVEAYLVAGEQCKQIDLEVEAVGINSLRRSITETPATKR